jgi:hypothetical protein
LIQATASETYLSSIHFNIIRPFTLVSQVVTPVVSRSKTRGKVFMALEMLLYVLHSLYSEVFLDEVATGQGAFGPACIFPESSQS